MPTCNYVTVTVITVSVTLISSNVNLNKKKFTNNYKAPVRITTKLQKIQAFCRYKSEINANVTESDKTMDPNNPQTKKRLEEGKSLGGLKPVYETPEQMQADIDKYFAENNEPRMCGLALSLGFCSRQTLLNYKAKPDFMDVVKKATLRVEDCYERDLRKTNATGPIFALKNMGWKDHVDLNLDDRTEGEKLEVEDIKQRLNRLEAVGDGISEG